MILLLALACAPTVQPTAVPPAPRSATQSVARPPATAAPAPSATSNRPLRDLATLHPVAPDVYVDVLDVQAMLRAYSSAPLVRLAADEEMKKLGAATQAMGFDVESMLAGATPPQAGSADGGVSGILAGLVAVSVSITGLDGGSDDPAGPRDRLGMLLVAAFSSDAAAERARSWIRATPLLAGAEESADDASADATAPASGAAGTPVASESSGSGLALERHRARAFGKTVEAWSARDGALLFLGAGRARAADLEARLAGRAPGFAADAAGAGDESAFTPSAGVTVLRAWTDVARAAPWSVFAAPSSPGAAPESSGAASGSIGAASGSGVQGAVETLAPAFVPLLGTRGRWRMQLRGDRFVTEGLYRRSPETARLDELFGMTPVTPDLARLVPKEAVGAWITTIDPAKLEELLRGALGSRSGADADSLPADAPIPAGATGNPGAGAPRAEERLASALGGRMVVYLLPYDSITTFIPRIVLAVDVTDAARARRGVEALGAEMRAADPGLTVDSRAYHKIQLLTFSRSAAGAGAEDEGGSGAGVGGSAKPTIAILPDRMIVTLSPSVARTEIRRAEAKKPEPHALADEGRFPKDAFEAGTMDWAGLFGKLYDTARGFLPMLAQGGGLGDGAGLPFDPASLPAASAFTRFFAPSWSWSRRVDGRIHSYFESSFGPETPLALAALALAVEQSRGSGGTTFGASAGSRRTPDAQPGAAAAEPGPTEGRAKFGDAPAAGTATKARLRNVKTGLAVYRGQIGRLPAKLPALLDPTESFPKGFVDSAETLRDEWGRELGYEPAADGARFTLWSFGPDGIDQRGAGDDVTAP